MLWLVPLLVVPLMLHETMSLKVSDVFVDTHLYPQNPVRVGSDPNFIIQAATTVGQGTTQVFSESSSMEQQTTARVVIDDIRVDAPKKILTNVPFPTRGYKFSVKLRMASVFRNFYGIPFDCKVEPRYVGYVVPWMDPDNGNLYCLFFPYSPEYLLRSLARVEDLRSWPILFVSIKASLRGANQVSGSAPAVLVGGFSILEMRQETMVLNLTPDSNTSFITLVGNTDVQVHFNGRDIIKVSPIRKEDFGIGGRVVYEVKVLRAIRFREKIIITLPLNGQKVEIEVNFKERYEPPSGLEKIDYILFLLVAGTGYSIASILKRGMNHS